MWPTCFLSMIPEKGIYSLVVESLPGLTSEVQSVLSQRNIWRANLPHFQTASLSGRQEPPPRPWPLSLKLTVLSTACVLDCSCKCWLCWLYASFSMARLFFHLLNYHRAQAEWQWHGKNHRKCVRFPASSHQAALGFWGQELPVISIKMTTKGKKEGRGIKRVKTVGTLKNIYLINVLPMMVCTSFSNVYSLITIGRVVLFFVYAWTQKG